MTAGEGLTVRVSWLTVENADTYTVNFNQVNGDGQMGNCRSSHRAAQTVNAISGRGNRMSASIPVGTNVDSPSNDMLRAFTTYTVVVVAQSNTLGNSISSQPVLHTTPQIGKEESKPLTMVDIALGAIDHAPRTLDTPNYTIIFSHKILQ